MKKDKSVILFGLSFIIALLGEVYLLNMNHIDNFSVVGIGIVVILTAYLWMDSIMDLISSKNQVNDNEKDSSYTELLNIQKATYAALKKSNQKMEEEIDQIKEAQQKALDGQIKALNISVNYNKENTKELIKAIKEECKGINYEEELMAIFAHLENYNQEKAEKEEKAEKDEKEEAELEITPLYDDPNAALSVDEIAKLFNSYGR